MDKLQYDSFYKFLVSLGIVLITIPILALLYLLNADYIIISQREYAHLSAISLQSIETHEQALKLIDNLIPTISIPLVLIGIILIIIGCCKWYGIQKELDQQIKSDTITKQINATQLSASESTSKAIDEIKTEQETAKQISSDRVVKYLEVEDKCFNYYYPKLSRRYHLKQNLQIAKGKYDIVGISKRKHSDLLFEIKFWVILPSDARLKQLYSNIKYLGENYKENTDHNFEYIIVIVTSRALLEKMQHRVRTFYSNYIMDISETINFEFLAEEDL